VGAQGARRREAIRRSDARGARGARRGSAVPPPTLREPLEALAAWYLAREWSDGHALDPVARFHLGNGARLERINWLADTSPKGVAQSFGMMVNYATTWTTSSATTRST
jgi:hypothetical protein